MDILVNAARVTLNSSWQSLLITSVVDSFCAVARLDCWNVVGREPRSPRDASCLFAVLRDRKRIYLCYRLQELAESIPCEFLRSQLLVALSPHPTTIPMSSGL